MAASASRPRLARAEAAGSGEQRSVRFSSSIAISATLGVLEAVRGGMGASVLPDFVIANDLAAGRLIHLMPRWQLESGGIHAVVPATRFRPARVSAFIDILAEQERGRKLVKTRGNHPN